jgi:hypothetical protein
MIAVIFIYTIFVVAFFGGLLVDYKIIPPVATLLSEFSVLFLFFISIVGKRKDSPLSFHLGLVYVFFVMITICSAFLNNRLNLSIIIGLRPILRFYILYLALINLDLSESKYRVVNNLLFTLFIVQLPASFIRFYFQGIQENTIGTYAGHGGGLTPIIPIVALGYLAGFYAEVRQRMTYLLVGIGFVLFGILGAKRAIFFMYPPAFLGIYYVAFFKAKKISAIKHIGLIVMGVIGIICVQTLAIKVMPSLNPENKVGGSVNLEHILTFAEKYEKSIDERGAANSRFGTTTLAFKVLFDAGIGEILFGFGPGSLTSSELDSTFERQRYDKRLKPLYRSYGYTGMMYIVIEYGVLGLVILSSVFFVFIYRSLRWLRLESDPYWRALAVGTVVFTFLQTFIFFTYNALPVTSGTIVPVYFYAMALMHYRLNNNFNPKRMMRKI